MDDLSAAGRYTLPSSHRGHPTWYNAVLPDTRRMAAGMPRVGPFPCCIMGVPEVVEEAPPMATLTIDLPEGPRPQAAWRLAADCPHCGAPLVLRQNRQTGVLFTGCSAYPHCAFRAPHDPRVQTL